MEQVQPKAQAGEWSAEFVPIKRMALKKWVLKTVINHVRGGKLRLPGFCKSAGRKTAVGIAGNYSLAAGSDLQDDGLLTVMGK